MAIMGSLAFGWLYKPTSARTQLARPDPDPAVEVVPTTPTERRVGISYAVWHYTADWPMDYAWGHPLLGPYDSSNREIMRKHAAMLYNASVDFVLVDLSNTLAADLRNGTGSKQELFVENSTKALFEEWSSIERTPHIALMIGNPLEKEAITNGHLQRKVDEVFQIYLDNPKWRTIWEVYLGKPLLVVYVGTPSPYQNGTPAWSDPRFSIRWMTGFLSDQPALLTHSKKISRDGYWSWEDRGDPTFSLFDGHPEEMTVVASWRGNMPPHPPPGRSGGKTFRDSWTLARAIGPRYVLAGTWNEWRRGEQPTPEISKDVEPSVEQGSLYLDILRQEARLFKAGK